MHSIVLLHECAFVFEINKDINVYLQRETEYEIPVTAISS